MRKILQQKHKKTIHSRLYGYSTALFDLPSPHIFFHAHSISHSLLFGGEVYCFYFQPNEIVRAHTYLMMSARYCIDYLCVCLVSGPIGSAKSLESATIL